MYEWDPRKAKSNLIKHRIDFADATTALEDEAAITIDEEVGPELRHVTIGTDSYGRILVVVYAWREDKIRVISARRAGPRERREYERRDR